MEERYRSMIVVDLMLTRDNKENGKKEILLALRKNTGYNDGEYELPGGHVDEGEDLMNAMIREAEEELKIKLKIEHNLNVPDIISSFRNLDFMISMRFHGCLLALKYGIRTCALSYDQKVEKLANELNIPYVNLNTDNDTNYNLDDVFKKLLCLDKRQLVNKVESINFRFESIRDCLTKIKNKKNNT